MNRSKSFFQKNAQYFLIYVIGILVAIGVVYVALDMFSEISMRHYLGNTYSEVPEAIVKGNYSDFSKSKLGDGFIEVYNEKGEIIYPKGSEVQLGVTEFQYIPDEFRRPIVTTVSFEDFKGNRFREITLEYYTELNKSGSDVLLIDDQDKVVYSTLKNLDKQLNKRTIDIITGTLNDEYEISKENFISEKGDYLTVVYFRKYSNFNRITNSIKGIRGYKLLAFILIFIFASVIYLIVLNKKVKKPLKLLAESIKEVSFGNTEKIIKYQGPREFENVCHSFNDMQQRLTKAIEEKKQLEDEKSKILADISHDLKTPVTVINGFSKALMEGRIPEKDKKRIYQRLMERSSYLGQLITSFSEYNRLDRSDIKIILDHVDFSNFTRNYFIGKYDEITLKGYGLDIDIQDNIYTIADTFLLKRVFENIVSNTLKYTPEGTTISFKLESHSKKVIIFFGDDGAGIPADIIKDVFNPFVVGEEARSTAVGSGLGMAIVKKIIDLHGGEIELIDTQSSGTVYKITLNTL